MTEGGPSALFAELLFVIALIVAWNSGALAMAIDWLISLKVGR